MYIVLKNTNSRLSSVQFCTGGRLPSAEGASTGGRTARADAAKLLVSNIYRVLKLCDILNHGKNIILAPRGPHRQNEFGKAVIAMRGPQIDNVFGKAVIDNVYTLPRFARTSVKQCIFQGGD